MIWYRWDNMDLYQYLSVKLILGKLWLKWSLLLFLLFFVLGFPQAVSLFDPCDCLAFTLLQPLPSFFSLPISLDDLFFSLPLFLDLSEVSFEVVEFIRDPLEFFLSLTFGIGAGKHFLIIRIDKIYKLCFVGGLLIFMFGLSLIVLIP